MSAHDRAGVGSGVQASLVAAARNAALDSLLTREITLPGVAPAAVVGWARRASSGAAWRVSIGAAGAAVDAIFDLASLTKPLTALVAMRLADRHGLPLDSRAVEWLPELAGAAASNARLVDLLSHRAGLPAWGAIYREDPWSTATPTSEPPPAASSDVLPTFETMLRRAASRRTGSAQIEPSHCLYSDLGYILAGAILERAIGDARRPLADAFDVLGGPRVADRMRAALTNFDARVQPTEHVAWRGGDVRGVVHDENAWMIERAGATPGHAGAFGTVDDVLAIGMAMIDAVRGDDTSLLSVDAARTMIAPRGGGTHRIGWDGVTVGASSSGTRFGVRTFGHLGFTGTSLWADPDAGVVAVLLTNRTYPHRNNARIRVARPRVHDALWSIDDPP